MTPSQTAMVDGIYEELIGQLINADYSFDGTQGLIDPISMAEALPLLNEVWLNPKYHQLIIGTIIAEDREDSGNWSNVYDAVYTAINEIKK